MGKPVEVDEIRAVIGEALALYVQELRFPGIRAAELNTAGLSSEQLLHVAAQLEQHGKAEITVSAEVHLFLRISNSDVLQSVETTEFLITVADERDDLRAVANTKQDWGMAWERGIRPIKQAALESMRTDLREIDSSMPENSDTYRAAMVLLASEFVGPYPDRIITFTVYPGEFVDAIGVRLWEAKIWETDEVRCEGWFDPETGGIAFVRDLMIAEGKLVRQWSYEKNQYLYYLAEH